MLAIASRLSNVLCGPGGLFHEAYISLYAQGASVCIIPLFILLFIVTNAKRANYLTLVTVEILFDLNLKSLCKQ